MIVISDWRGENGGLTSVGMDGSLPPIGKLLSSKELARSSHDSIHFRLPELNAAGNKTTTQPASGGEQSRSKTTINDTPTRVQINYIARDKALSILQQYNSMVSDDTSLAIRNLPHVKVPMHGNDSRANRRRLDRTSKTAASVFTEGISSISTPHGPSFLVSKDTVVRANLPDDVSLAQHHNQFAFNIKQKRRKPVVKDGVGTPHYKQLKMLGLENIPLIELGAYMRKQLSEKKNGGKGQHNGTYTRATNDLSPLRRFDQPNVGSVGATPKTFQSGRQALRTSLKSKVDTKYKGNKTPIKVAPTYLGSSYRADRLNIVSLGNSDSAYSDKASPRKIAPGMYPQYDWRTRVNEEYRRLKFVPVEPSLNGMCSQASSVKIGLHSREFPPLNFSDDVPKRFPSYEGTMKRIFRDVVFEKNAPPLYRRSLYRSGGPTTSATSSSTSNSNHVLNPPPSFVSSSDEAPSPRPQEMFREMLPLKEETIERHGNSPSLLKPGKLNPLRIKPATQSLPPRTLVEKNRVAKPRKEPSVGNVVYNLGAIIVPHATVGTDSSQTSSGPNSLKSDGSNGLLSIPDVAMTEGRPPMIATAEQKPRPGGDTDSQYSDSSSHKVALHTLQLVPDSLPVRPSVTSMTPVISVTSDSGVNEPVLFKDTDSEDSFGAYSKKATLASKNLEFVSPLIPGQQNAKRQ